MTIHFYVSRKADGTPLFLRPQGFNEPLRDMRRHIATSLFCRSDMDHATIHAVGNDATFDLVETVRRDESTGFYPCYSCDTLTYEKYRCKQCDKACCDTHRKLDPRTVRDWYCEECAAARQL